MKTISLAIFDWLLQLTQPKGRGGWDTKFHMSILMGVIFTMLVAPNEQKLTIGQSGAGFLLVVFYFLPITFLASVS